ncbi:MAG: hypothetical protein AAF433_20965 [Bacteroidota bacterium]
MLLNKFCSLLLLLLLACQPSTPSYENFLLPTAEIRYQERSRELRAIVQLRQGDSLASSTTYEAATGSVSFLGSPMMDQLSTAAGQRWQATRKIDWPAELYFSLPQPDFKNGDERFDLRFAMAPPTADSIPAIIDRAQGARFKFSNQALAANESLLLFFETRAWNPGVKRVLLAGPTNSAFFNLPAATIQELPAGNYEVYLVKQALVRDSLAQLKTSTQIEYFTRSRSVEVR